jgi:HSP20 family protein
MAETSTTVQRTGEKSAAIHPVKFDKLVERVNNMFETVAKRAYEIFEGKGRTIGHDLEDWFQAETEFLHPVHVQVAESGDKLEVKAEVPGFNEKEIEVSVEPRRLTISGKRESSKEEKRGKTVYAESCSDQILRVVDPPIAIDADKVTATLKNGVLRLTMPKASKGTLIEIKPKAA